MMTLTSKKEVSKAKASWYNQACETSISCSDPYLIRECQDVLEWVEGFDDAIFLLAFEKCNDPNYSVTVYPHG